MITVASNADTRQYPSGSAEHKAKPRVDVPRTDDMTSYKLSKLVTSLPRIGGTKRAVLRAMCDHYPNIWLSIPKLAQEAGFGTTATRKSVRGLETDGLIHPVGARKGGRNLSEQYLIDVKKILAETQRSASALSEQNPMPGDRNPTPGEQNPTPRVAEQRTNKESNKNLACTFVRADVSSQDHDPISDDCWSCALAQVTEYDRRTPTWDETGEMRFFLVPAEQWLQETLDALLEDLITDPTTGNEYENSEWWWDLPQSQLDEWFLGACIARAMGYEPYTESVAVEKRWKAAIAEWKGATQFQLRAELIGRKETPISAAVESEKSAEQTTMSQQTIQELLQTRRKELGSGFIALTRNEEQQLLSAMVKPLDTKGNSEAYPVGFTPLEGASAWRLLHVLLRPDSAAAKARQTDVYDKLEPAVRETNRNILFVALDPKYWPEPRRGLISL